jgi:sec-independent protein translocase protein TatC
VQQSGSFDRDAFVRFGRSVRNAFFAVRAFVDALLDSEAWALFGRRAFKRVVVIAIVGVAFAGITWTYSTEIFQWLLVPAKGNLTPFDGGMPVFTAPQEMFGVTVNLAFKGGMLAAFPVFVVSVYTLFSQWLPSSVRTFLKIFVPSVFLAFAGGVAFVYYVILPTSLTFLLSFGEGVAVPLISVTHYFDMVLSLMFWMGVLFDLPLAMYLLTRTGLVSYRKLKWARLAVWFFAPILAAIITPSFDAWTWALVMAPLVLLYEVGLFLARMADRRRGSAT